MHSARSPTRAWIPTYPGHRHAILLLPSHSANTPPRAPVARPTRPTGRATPGPTTIHTIPGVTLRGPIIRCARHAAGCAAPPEPHRSAHSADAAGQSSALPARPPRAHNPSTLQEDGSTPPHPAPRQDAPPLSTPPLNAPAATQVAQRLHGPWVLLLGLTREEPPRRFDTPRHPQLPVGPLQVCPHRPDPHPKPIRDLLVGQPLQCQLQDLRLPPR